MTRDSFKMNERLSRGSSLFGTDPQVLLRNALRNNDIATFKRLASTVDLEHVYQYPDYKTCLEIAVSEPNKLEFVKYLLQQTDVDVNTINETHAAAPIHFAVDNGNLEALKLLLEVDRIDINLKSKGNTALLLAIKKIEDLEDDRERDISIYEDMVELLLKAGCDPNAPDLKGITPVYSAAKQGIERIITLILDYAKTPIDIDTYKDRRGRTARFYLKEAFPHLASKFDDISEVEEIVNVDKLFSYLSRHEEDNFIKAFSKLTKADERRSVFAANNGNHTMLQYATEKGFEKAVETLLNGGADVNATCAGNTIRPIAIACQNGFSKILKLFIDQECVSLEPANGESLLQITVKGMRSYYKNPKSDFNECLELLIKNPKTSVNVNHMDIKGNTALHYAARNGDNETVLELLRNGACVGLRNTFNEPPLADLHAKTLETFLDECITTNGERPSDDDYEIHMKYRFLVYPNNSLENELLDNSNNKPLMDKSNNNAKEFDAILAPETDALLYMTHNEELRPLLKHPVITSFLYLKWQRISCLFYANIIFYSLLWLSLILYIVLGYGVEKKQSGSIEVLNVVTHVGAIIGLILLVFRELFQLLVSPTRYLQSIENWMEIALIIVTAWIVCYDSSEESTKQQLSAVAILLSSAELVLLIGQFPTLSTNIVMLRTVSWNFLKFLLWYCILIIAFALSFYTLFRKFKVEDQVAPNPNKEETEEDEDFFEDPGKSLFKTIVMLTGEFDAGSIKFSTFPVTSHIIFIVFVFMIPIVLFNLLNGLAVSDTQEIRADAELVGHISRIKMISYFESVLIGNARSVYEKPSKCWLWLPKNLQDLKIIKPKALCIKPFARRISLFPHFLPKYKIVVKPNKKNLIEIPHPEPLSKLNDYEDVESGGCCLERCQNYRLDRKIVKNAKIVITKKTSVSELDEIKEKLDSLESIVKSVLQSLESSRKY